MSDIGINIEYLQSSQQPPVCDETSPFIAICTVSLSDIYSYSYFCPLIVIVSLNTAFTSLAVLIFEPVGAN